ncbi:ferredoxin--NADP reductase [Vibrio sp. AK197]|uniref:ferredoxin--NADP(+) reductase n=1 Tax=Vibrio olivae TaxID=1243002 RepID=A0ABV5HN63_9VIBR
MLNYPGFQSATVTQRTDWTSELFSLRVSGADLSFKAGQFTKLALPNAEGKLVSRAYSVVNAPLSTSDMLEFLIIANPQGQLSPQLQALNVGQSLYVGTRANGDLLGEVIPKRANDLWLLSSGTGIGPFLSLLDDIHLRPRCEKIILVHAVRHRADLVYQYLIQQLIQLYDGRLQYVPIVSREPTEYLSGRIPQLIASGALSQHTGVDLSADESFVMLCGNPQMIKDTLPVLKELGLEKYRVKTGGHIVYERYW